MSRDRSIIFDNIDEQPLDVDVHGFAHGHYNLVL
jgi:hypothetical protein